MTTRKTKPTASKSTSTASKKTAPKKATKKISTKKTSQTVQNQIDFTAGVSPKSRKQIRSFVKIWFKGAAISGTSARGSLATAVFAAVKAGIDREAFLSACEIEWSLAMLNP